MLVYDSQRVSASVYDDRLWKHRLEHVYSQRGADLDVLNARVVLTLGAVKRTGVVNHKVAVTHGALPSMVLLGRR